MPSPSVIFNALVNLLIVSRLLRYSPIMLRIHAETLVSRALDSSRKKFMSCSVSRSRKSSVKFFSYIMFFLIFSNGAVLHVSPVPAFSCDVSNLFLINHDEMIRPYLYHKKARMSNSFHKTIQNKVRYSWGRTFGIPPPGRSHHLDRGDPEPPQPAPQRSRNRKASSDR